MEQATIKVIGVFMGVLIVAAVISGVIIRFQLVQEVSSELKDSEEEGEKEGEKEEEKEEEEESNEDSLIKWDSLNLFKERLIFDNLQILFTELFMNIKKGIIINPIVMKKYGN